jgi:hypothetical protein
MAGGRKLNAIEARERRQKADVTYLLRQPQFQRFLWRVIQSSGLFARTADGSQDGAVAALARRNLGLVILEMVEEGQPAAHPEGVPILTLIQTLREEANPPPSERDDDEERNNDARYDRNAELDDGDGEDDPDRR